MKIFKNLFYCLLLFSIFVPISLDGQPRQSVTGDGLGSGGEPERKCQLRFNINMSLANLDHFSPLGGEVYIPELGFSAHTEFLPTGYPEMFISLTIDNQTYTNSIKYFIDPSFYPNFDFGIENVINGQNMYTASTSFLVDLCHLCPILGKDEIFIDAIPFALELVDKDGNPYQACKYTGADDIFSCEVFSNPICSDKDGICDNKLLTFAIGSEKIVCVGLPTTTPGKPIRKQPSTQNVIDEIVTLPNPFTEQMTVKIPSDIYEGTLTMMSIDGLVVRRYEEVYGNSVIDIKGNDLANGTYIIIVQDGNNKYHTRVIKI